MDDEDDRDQAVRARTPQPYGVARVWSLRTLAAVAITTVALSGAGGAALAAASDGGGGGGPGGRGGFGGPPGFAHGTRPGQPPPGFGAVPGQLPATTAPTTDDD